MGLGAVQRAVQPLGQQNDLSRAVWEEAGSGLQEMWKGWGKWWWWVDLGVLPQTR